MPPRHLDDGEAARLAHQRRRGIDDRGLDEHGADVAAPAGLVQCLRHQPVAVDGQALEGEAEIGRERHQRVMADRLRRHGRAGRRGRHQRHRHAGRRAVGDADVERRDGKPAALQPLDGRGLVARKDVVRPERQRRARRQVVAQPRQRLLHPVEMHGIAHRLEDRQVHHLPHPLRQGGRDGLRPARLHEGAAPDLAGDQPAADQLLIGTADRLHRQVEVVREPAMGRQPRAVGQPSVVDRPGDLVRQRQVGRPADERRVGAPHCHDLIRDHNQCN